MPWDILVARRFLQPRFVRNVLKGILDVRKYTLSSGYNLYWIYWLIRFRPVLPFLGRRGGLRARRPRRHKS